MDNEKTVTRGSCGYVEHLAPGWNGVIEQCLNCGSRNVEMNDPADPRMDVIVVTGMSLVFCGVIAGIIILLLQLETK